MKITYKNGEVDILLKDITGLVEPLGTKEREQRIPTGTHYCEMLPLEYKPSPGYMEAYEAALEHFGKTTALAVGRAAEKIYRAKGKEGVLVSLARAGIPAGVLIRRYLKNKYDTELPHYAISIIRGRGIDHNAVNYILERHKPWQIQFLDGWVGKGAIYGELKKALKDWPDIDPSLAVLSDPANLTALCGTHEDILIPSSCLNATVTGLISRTFLRSDIIGEHDFHGAAFYGELEQEDLTNIYLDQIEEQFDYEASWQETGFPADGQEVVKNIASVYRIKDQNFIKPGIGEATRVLLRRMPWKLLISPEYENSEELRHLVRLAAEKRVPIEPSLISLGSYKACGLIKNIADA